MPPIEGNFDDELEILWEGRGVIARGPLKWFPDSEGKSERASVALHVAVMQNGGSAMGRTGDDVPQDADEFLVAAAVQGNGTLTPGPAIATGLALVHGNGVEMYQWSYAVTLKPKAKAKAKANPKEPSADMTEDLSLEKKDRAHA
jgi:hypothetical protein